MRLFSSPDPRVRGVGVGLASGAVATLLALVARVTLPAGGGPGGIPPVATAAAIAMVGALVTAYAMTRTITRDPRPNDQEQRVRQAEEALTAQKRIEADLVQARDISLASARAKCGFVASLSHELRTPLNAVVGYSEMLAEEAAASGDVQYLPDFERLRTASRQLLALINDVLDLARAEAGSLQLTVERVDAGVLAREAATAVLPSVGAHGPAVEVTVADEPALVLTDAARVSQVVTGLVRAAARFTRSPRITLEVRREHTNGADWVAFQVSRFDVGLEVGVLRAFFEDYTQVDPASVQECAGALAGLALSQVLTRQLGGVIVVDGSGSVVCRIPVEHAALRTLEAPPPGDHAGAASVPAPKGDALVLVIDDDPAARDLLAWHLRREGLTPVLASSGQRGLELARTLRPAAITLDVVMPEMDGWAVLEALKADPAVASIPVVLVTIAGDRRRALSLGAAAVLDKPIDGTKLAGTLRASIGPSESGDVLVVEDDPAARAVLARYAKGLGCQVRTAEDGRAALDEARRLLPALVLLDLMMPEADGFQFLEELRALPHGERVPVVVITAATVSEAMRARLTGRVLAVLQKSGRDCQALLPTVAQIVRRTVRTRSAAEADGDGPAPSGRG